MGFPKMEIFDGLDKQFLCPKNTKNTIKYNTFG
jgi:hypothetical protein